MESWLKIFFSKIKMKLTKNITRLALMMTVFFSVGVSTSWATTVNKSEGKAGSRQVVNAPDRKAAAGKNGETSGADNTGENKENNEESLSFGDGLKTNDPSRIGVTVEEIDSRIKALQQKEKDGIIGSEEALSLEDYLAIRKCNQEILQDVKTMEWIYGFINMDPNNNRYLTEHNNFFKELEEDRKTLESITSADTAILIAKYSKKKEQATTAYNRVKNFYDNSNNFIKDSTAKIGELTALTQENNAALTDVDQTVNQSKYLRLKAQNASYASKINVIQFMLNNYDISYKNLGMGVNLRQEIVAEAEKFLDELNKIQHEFRKKELSETKDMVDEIVNNASSHPAVLELAEKNRYTQKLIEEINHENNKYVIDNNRITKMIDEAQKFEADIDNQISYFKGTVYLAKILLDPSNLYKKASLPDNFTDTLSEHRMMSYRIRHDMNELENEKKVIYEQYKDEFAADPKLEESVKSNLELRLKLLSELNLLLNANTRNAMSLQISYTSYEKLRQRLKEKVKNALFWNPSNLRGSKKWLNQIVDNISNRDFFLVSYFNSLRLTVPEPKQLLVMVGLVLAFVIAFCVGRIANKKKDVIIKNYNKQMKAGYSDALIALFADAMHGLKWFLVVFFLGYVFSNVTELYNSDDIESIIMDGRSLFIVWGVSLLAAGSTFFLKFYSENGINNKLFNVDFDRVLYRTYRNIFICISLIWLVILWRINSPKIFSSDLMGQLIMFLVSLYLSGVFIKLLLRSLKKNNVLLRKKFIYAIAAAACITQTVITYMGYYYSAVLICHQIIISLFIILVYDLLRSLVKRTFRVYTFKQRYKQWREEQKKKMENSAGQSAEDDLDIALIFQSNEISANKVSEQTVTIVDQIFIFILAVILYSIWGDLITVTNYLKNFTLYKVGSGDAGRAITAFDMLLVTYALGIGAVVIKNLPGVMQVLIFNQWEWLKKYSYSVTTIITYLLIAIDTAFVCSTIGLGWDKVQWLVAALSVGLGFGLQEIFANFVSGLILLFERPVRIGDIITINDHSGTVSRIRIRATTIVDFDLKEYVVPNRSLITSALTNWTLRDTITRVVIQVGVGYGSDIDKVKRLLTEIAARNPYVMSSPEPKIYFMSFGESNLNIDFYLYTKKISDRYPCIDTINSDIFKTFNANNIEIAFNQVDVYVKNVKDGQEIKIDSVDMLKQKSGSTEEAYKREMASSKGTNSGTEKTSGQTVTPVKQPSV